MRLPFPERIPLLYVFFFAALLGATQLVEGTSNLFVFCSFLFIIIATLTFNLAGGFTRPSGSYVFFYAVLGVIIGLTWKAILGEPADSNLLAPLLTIRLYLCGITTMLGAVYISRKLTRKQAVLQNLMPAAKMQNAVIGCMVTGILITLVLYLVPHPNGSILAALTQVNRFLALAILLGVTRQIQKSGGTSCITLPVLISFVVLFVSGVFGFSKEAMITPFFCVILAASSQRYRVSLQQIIGGTVAMLLFSQFLVPYSQYGRNFETLSTFDNVSISISLLSNLGQVRKEYLETEEDSSEDRAVSYYDTPQGFFDRLQMIAIDDALNNYTEEGHTFGLAPVWANFANLIPHVFWKDKPRIYFGTIYAGEIGGLLPEGDTTTGVSFTSTAEAFHLARWTGIFVVAPILYIMFFTLFDSLFGDVRKAPWGLLAIPMIAHAAPEGGFSGIVYMSGYGAFVIFVAAYATAWLMPIVGTFIIGPEKLADGNSRRLPARVSTRTLPQIDQQSTSG